MLKTDKHRGCEETAIHCRYHYEDGFMKKVMILKRARVLKGEEKLRLRDSLGNKDNKETERW